MLRKIPAVALASLVVLGGAEAKADELHVVPHFHFDLAWYEDERAFLRRGATVLERFVDKAAVDPEFRFIVDQVPLLRALEERNPKAFASLQALVAEGRVAISGASYTQAYEAVLGSESVARQFAHGQAYIKSRFGAPSSGLWNIDVSMYFATYPGVLAQADVTHAFRGWGLALGAGIDVGPSEIVWRGPDGAELVVHHNVGMDYRPAREHVQSYGDALIGRDCKPDPAVEAATLEKIFKTLGAAAPTPLLLGLDGDDFTDPPCTATQVARAWTDAHPERPVRVTTASEFFAALAPHTAELPRPPQGADIGVWGSGQEPNPFTTARMSIKIENRRTEQALENAERIGALASYAGYAFPAAELRAAWEDVLPNQDHNIVTGSAVDTEYAIVRERYDRSRKTAQKVIDAAAAHLAAAVATAGAPSGATAALVVVNPLARPRAGVATADVDLPPGTVQFALTDEAGADMRYQRLAPAQCDSTRCRATVAFPVELPAFGWRTIYVSAGRAPGVDPTEQVDAGSEVLFENDVYSARIGASGHVESLRDKQTDRELIGASGRDAHTAVALSHVHGQGQDIAPDAAASVPVGHAIFTLDPSRSLRAVALHRAVALMAMVAERPDGGLEPVDLSAVYDCDVVSPDADRLDVDAIKLPGRSANVHVGLPAEELSSTVHCQADGVAFALGSFGAGQDNAICRWHAWRPGTDVAVTLSGSYSRLHVLTLGGPSTVLQARYDDGDGEWEAQYPPAPFAKMGGSVLPQLLDLPAVGNQVVLIDDAGHTQEADLGAMRGTTASVAQQHVTIRRGPVMTTVVASASQGKDRVERETRLYVDDARIDFVTRIDWTASQALVAAYFPFAVDSAGSTQGIPFGQSRRTNGFWPALGFRDIADHEAGVALLDRGLSEAGVFNGRTLLPLLRSTRHLFSPDDNPGSFDRGAHVFEYAIAPHRGDPADREADRFAFPATVVATGLHSGALPSTGSLLEVGEEARVTSVSRDGEDLVVRFHERTGVAQRVELRTTGEARGARRVNLLDRTMTELDDGAVVRLDLKPMEMATVRFQLTPHWPSAQAQAPPADAGCDCRATAAPSAPPSGRRALWLACGAAVSLLTALVWMKRRARRQRSAGGLARPSAHEPTAAELGRLEPPSDR